MPDPTTTSPHDDALAAAPHKTEGGLLKWTTSMPSNVMSMLNPFSNADEGKEGSRPEKKEKLDTDVDAQAQQQPANKRTSMFAGFLPSALLGGYSTPKKDGETGKEDDLTMFAEPETRSNSDGGSREGSIFDELGRHKAKRSKCAKTSYSICHPAPTSTTRQRLHRRPRSMMQLHKLSADKRPRPAFEVIPSANFSVRLTKAITKVFKTKHGLCPNDLVVLRAEKYAAAEDDGNEEQDERDIIALMCKGRHGDATSSGGRARICLPGGREWEAYPTLNGGYEFFSTDEHGLGLTVRWVVKKGKDGAKPTDPMKKKFNFSTISPNSRRHPVIATMSRTGLDINDTYRMPDANAATPLSTPKQGATVLADALDEEDVSTQQEVCETDPRLRETIIMTGIWVAFKEGWSPFYKYDDKDKDAAALAVQRSPSMPAHSPAKSSTFALASPVSTPPASPLQAPLQKRPSIKSIGSGTARRGGNLFRRGSSDNATTNNRRSTVSVPEGDEPGEPTSPAPVDPAARTGRSRANSNSTVLVHRAASNRRRKHEAAWRPDLLTAQQEAANEDPSTPSPRQKRRSRADSSDVAGRRRDSVARPILPPSASQRSDESAASASAAATAATPTPKKKAEVQRTEEKRESSATTATASSRGEGKLGKPNARERKRSGWRRLLCGSGEDV